MICVIVSQNMIILLEYWPRKYWDMPYYVHQKCKGTFRADTTNFIVKFINK